MRKVLMLAAVLAMMLVAAMPAIAAQQNNNNGGQQNNNNGGQQNNNNDGDGVSQDIGAAEQESGDVEIGFDVSNEGNNSNQCAAPLQFGQTGNVNNSQGVLQYESEADDFELTGGETVFAPEFEQSCEQAVQQSAAASSS